MIFWATGRRAFSGIKVPATALSKSRYAKKATTAAGFRLPLVAKNLRTVVTFFVCTLAFPIAVAK
jgi:hypothetical protein